jgi:chemotaxis protein methyltransferase CheR
MNLRELNLNNSDFNRVIDPGGMSDSTFSRFSAFVQNELGIKMPEGKKTMLQARLSKRLRKLGISDFDDYYEFVFSSDGIETELQNMIDVVTTNKTDFFREPRHFDYLIQTALPELIRNGSTKNGRKLLVWSAGCSTGEEPYTIAMILSHFAAWNAGFQFSILATDISIKVLKEAALGIYTEEDVEVVPIDIKKKCLLKSKDREKRKVRIVPELRSMIEFRSLNFMEDDYGLRRNRDIIFFRNVIIYFERSIQEKVLNRICQHLNPGGYMFMGHSETLNGLNVPLVQVASTIYRKPG